MKTAKTTKTVKAVIKAAPAENSKVTTAILAQAQPTKLGFKLATTYGKYTGGIFILDKEGNRIARLQHTASDTPVVKLYPALRGNKFHDVTGLDPKQWSEKRSRFIYKGETAKIGQRLRIALTHIRKANAA